MCIYYVHILCTLYIHFTILYYIILYYMILYYIILYYIILYHILLLTKIDSKVLSLSFKNENILLANHRSLLSIACGNK